MASSATSRTGSRACCTSAPGGRCRPRCPDLAAVSSVPLVRRFADHIRAVGWLRPGDRVLVGLSGGLDSVCLLHLLRGPAAPPALTLCAAHFDHALRPASALDAAWVRGLCRAWDVALVQTRAEHPPRGESAARALRYAFLQDAASTLHADWIATAHQADDQLETLLFRLARGTGLRGLRGIPARRGHIIRPLLPFRRHELLAYAREARLGWREDESNRALRFARNRIRHAVLPALEARWPGSASRLLQLADAAAVLERLWERLLPELVSGVVRERAEQRIVLARGVWQEYHPQTRARVMRELAHELGSPLGRAGTRAAMRFLVTGESGTRVRLGARLELGREFDRLVLSRAPCETGADHDLPVRIAADTAGTARARIGGAWFDVGWGPALPAGVATGSSASFDPFALHFPLELRGWRPGDRIRLGYGTKKLKKLFTERRIPASRRCAVPVLAEQAGRGGVLWVAGLARSSLAAGGSERWHITVNHGEST
ncbi:MAG: tRNA lysidine(34) synthetase TilS [Gemmatimonadetes bacterium]|nr:tRNA lysidine(34) synthetase TilS [Gemmatimonadota bacterium]